MILSHFLISTSVYMPLCQISWPCRQRLCASFAKLLCLGRHCPLQQDSRAVRGGTLHQFSVTKFREFCKDFCEILNWGCWRDWDSVHAGTKHFSTEKSRFRPKCWNAQELKATESSQPWSDSVRCCVQAGFFPWGVNLRKQRTWTFSPSISGFFQDKNHQVDTSAKMWLASYIQCFFHHNPLPRLCAFFVVQLQENVELVKFCMVLLISCESFQQYFLKWCPIRLPFRREENSSNTWQQCLPISPVQFYIFDGHFGSIIIRCWDFFVLPVGNII